MEALYVNLRDEIQSFEEHIRSCQKAFDIHTLSNVLQLLLPESGAAGDIQSLEQLEKLAESREWDGQDIVRITAGHEKSDIPGYVSWFISYVRYLSSLKEMFDTKVVFPLCENLYVNDDSLDALPLGSGEGRGPHTTASVAHTAKQLFALRRKWALLLKRDTIDGQNFSAQSLLDLQGFDNVHPFAKVMRLVPDLFHKSLATAALARQWVDCHASIYSSQPICPGTARTWNGTGVDGLEHQQYDMPSSQSKLSKIQSNCMDLGLLSKDMSGSGGATCIRTTSQERNKLHEVHEELMSLLWQEKRSQILETEIHKVNQRISNLQLQQEAKERELEALKNQLETDNWRVANRQRQAAFCELEALGRQLRLEQYRKSILQGDWMLELEVRPVLMRPIQTVRS
ncbi:hypothetical protein JD844_022236 [Phrynosoma platyrhinos]|uniref:Uncharacterized protein n=1 Tax=Phrynosoma platyrhinos TaxID=52577 RepID=A0ABQ7SV25_PHRPL|nr:hypothetical protein JD844_022236 [Phrynosoma platyrhinos]